MDLTTSATSPAKRAALPDAVIDRLFERLGGMYMARWLDSMQGCDIATVKRVWAEELAEVTPQAMKHALDSMKGEFPPSLPAFRALCRHYRPRETSKVVVLQAPFDREAARNSLRSLKRSLNVPDQK